MLLCSYILDESQFFWITLMTNLFCEIVQNTIFKLKIVRSQRSVAYHSDFYVSLYFRYV